MEDDINNDSAVLGKKRKPEPEWTEQFSLKHNRPYYYNKETNTSTWIKPVEFKQADFKPEPFSIPTFVKNLFKTKDIKTFNAGFSLYTEIGENRTIASFIQEIVNEIVKTRPNLEDTVYILVKLIVSISGELKIEPNKILGLLVFGNGHGGEEYILPADNRTMNQKVELLEYVPVVAEGDYGFSFTFNAGVHLMYQYYNKKGKMPLRKEKQKHRDYCSEKYKNTLATYKSNKQYLNYSLTKFVNQKPGLDISKAITNIKKNEIIKAFCEKNEIGVVSKIVIDMEKDYNENYEKVVDIMKKELVHYERDIAKISRSINTTCKMMKTQKSVSPSKKECICKNIQLLSSGGTIFANFFTMFYVLPEFTKKYLHYSTIIQTMMDEIIVEYKKRITSLSIKEESELLPDLTQSFYTFALFKNQNGLIPNIDGFSLHFLGYLYLYFESTKKPFVLSRIVEPDGKLNPAKLFILIGEAVPNIKTIYINNSCRCSISDDPLFMMSSQEEVNSFGGKRKSRRRLKADPKA
jgi:hypothetical protein